MCVATERQCGDWGPGSVGGDGVSSGTVPPEIDRLLIALRSDPTLEEHFPLVTMDELQQVPSKSGRAPEAIVSIVCLPDEKKGSKKGSKVEKKGSKAKKKGSKARKKGSKAERKESKAKKKESKAEKRGRESK